MLILCALVLSISNSQAQCLGGFKIFYDANMSAGGVSQLEGATEVFCHTGASTNNSGLWLYNPCTWGTTSTVGGMTAGGGLNNWELEITDPYTWYGTIPTGELIDTVAMVFRNGDGTLTGKGDNNSDIYVVFNGLNPIEIINIIGAVSVEYVEGVGVKKIDNVASISNFPNPTSDNSFFVYDLKSNANVSLNIIDATGRVITNLVNQNQTASRYKYDFNTLNIANGIYFYELKVNGNKITNSFVVSH